jgi:hypothetical protein
MSDLDLLRTVLEQHPTLTWRGWWTRWHDNNERTTTFAQARAETVDKHGLGQFGRALEFVDRAPLLRRVNRRRSTYGWKHVAERFHGHPRNRVAYIGEGSFIAACLARGLMIRRSEFGTYVNIAEAAAALNEPKPSGSQPSYRGVLA